MVAMNNRFLNPVPYRPGISMEIARAMLAILTPKQRLAVRCKSEGRTRAETARMLGVSSHRVRNLWNESRRRLVAANPELAQIQGDQVRTSVRAEQLSVFGN